MPYIPNTDNDRREMLSRIGAESFDDLIAAIPKELRLGRELAIGALTEIELLDEMKQMAAESTLDLACFAGGGLYDHFIPSALVNILSRPEFMTAYTPYQAEVAQGTLQVIYEFQTHICRLTGMDVANASMYDGATAAAEALLLAAAATKRNKVIVAESVSPLYRLVIETHLSPRGIEQVILPLDDGLSDMSRLEDCCDEQTAGILISQPNFFGQLEDIEEIEKVIHRVGGKLVMAVDPIAQAILKTPGEWGADIAVGEGQPMGVPLSFGGPLVGFFAVRKELIRRLPGRLVARTKDVDGRVGFVLTLQTREQHIRRDKATSNICTNQALCATAVAIYLSLMGKEGLRQVALLSADKAHRTAERLFALDGFEPYFAGPFVREFAVRTPVPASDVIAGLARHKLLAGIDASQLYKGYKGMDHCLIIATTEKRTDAEIARLVDGCREMATGGVLSKLQ